MVIMRPIGHGPERGAGRKDVRGCEHGHEGNKPAVRTAINSNAFGVDAMLLNHPRSAVYLVVDVLAAHEAVNIRAPIAAVAGAGTVVNIENGVPFVC